MQSSAIHNPRANLTPSQHEAANARRIRLDKIASRALAGAAGVAAVLPQPEEKSEPAPPSMAEWIERQKTLNPLPRLPWFSIEAEIDPPEPVAPRIETIQRVVAKHYGLTRENLICARRSKPLILPRHIGMYLCRELTMKSFPEIGRRFGRRDHTVPLYACRKVEGLINADPQVAADVDSIKAQLVQS